MHRTFAGTAAVLLSALAIAAPLASTAHAGPTTLHCAGSTTTACQQLDDLASQLGSVAPLLGTALAPLTTEAQGLAARSDSAAGVPTAQVLDVSKALLGQLGSLPAPVQTLVGATRLGALTGTLDALVGSLTAPVANDQQSAGSSGGATPAKTTTYTPAAAPVGGLRSTDSSSAAAPAAGGSTSSDAVPAVPVGDPLTLAPLALPDFGFDTAFTPVVTNADAAVPSAEQAKLAVADAMGGGSRTPELAVVTVLSLLLLAGAGVAQLQANRHQIPD